jgi:hypothetical protein
MIRCNLCVYSLSVCGREQYVKVVSMVKIVVQLFNSVDRVCLELFCKCKYEAHR